MFGDRENTHAQEEEPSDDDAESDSDDEGTEASSRSDDDGFIAEQNVERESLQERAHVKVEPNFNGS